MLRFLTNTHDPKDPNAMMYVSTNPGQSQLAAWREHQLWLVGKVIGDPQATAIYTVEELKQRGMVGVYVLENEEEM